MSESHFTHPPAKEPGRWWTLDFKLGVAVAAILVLSACSNAQEKSHVAFEDVSTATTIALDYYRANDTWQGFDGFDGSDASDAALEWIASSGTDTEGPGVSVMAESEDSITLVAQDSFGNYACTTIRSGPWWRGSGDGSGYPASIADCEGEPHPDMDLDMAEGDLIRGQMATIVYGREHAGFEGLAHAIRVGKVDPDAWWSGIQWAPMGPDVPPHRAVVVEEANHEATIAVQTDDERFVCLTISRGPPDKHYGRGGGFPTSAAECLAAQPMA